MKTTKNNKSKSTKKVAKSVTTNGVQKLPNGSYRVRKTVNKTSYDGVFKKRQDAVAYLDMLKGL